jgi:hypothetical protein
VDTTRSTGRRGTRQPVVALRIGLAALAAVVIIGIPQLGAPAPVRAGSSCTGWSSRTLPPRSIRVLRTGSGHVEKVRFRHYVAEVMASGEWPGRLHAATLEAGAVAVKQYAWYYAMRGHHRAGYVSHGRCYDVRDDTQDQLYHPGSAHPVLSQQRAIDATWALTLRKFGRFFLTGYRAGETKRCAADANGWKLYERSVEACARKGWSRQRILRTYLGPRLRSVWSQQLGPILASPDLDLRRGSSLSDTPATLTWQPTSYSPDAARYAVQRRVGRNSWQSIRLNPATSTLARVRLKQGAPNHFRVRGIDSRGRAGSWVYSAPSTAALRGPVGTQLGGGLEASALRRATWARTRFAGHAVALVATTGPGMGKVRVFVNGRREATVDLRRDSSTARELVWAMNFGRVRARTVAVKAVDRDKSVHFQGYYVLR